MKKYLMGGIAALAMGAGFTSCSHDDGDYTFNRQQSYQQAFEKEFGKIAENQTWGFVDQSVTTRTENVNRNEWGKGGNTVGGHVMVPANVTSDEYSKVLNEFSIKREGVVNTTNVNWTDFMVTQVHKGDSVYKDGFGNDVLGSDKMNHFQALKGEGGIDSDGKLFGDWEHVNDFNSGDQNTKWNTIEGHTYMENSGTMDFAYENSTDSKYHNEYIIIPGSQIDASLAGYYYVGFDFCATHPVGQESNKNMDVERDWVFNDWIVRISPAEFIGSQRIFVEDIITSDLNHIDPSDWDFNDAVFDAYIFYDQYNLQSSCAIITLRAAGGTLPLTIAGREVHQLFGVNQSTMVNTGNGTEKTPVQFRLSGNELTSGNANDIDVVVQSRQGETITLTANRGEATQKLAAPIANHVKWLKERVHIKNGYPTFMDYVNDPTKIWYNPAVEINLFQKYY